MAAGFWSTNTAAEPKRQFRWKVEFSSTNTEGLGGQGVIWFAKKVTLPSITVGEVKHSFVDKSFYFPGRVEWNTIELTLVDPVSPDAVELTMNMIEDSGYFMPNKVTNEKDLMSISKRKAIEEGLGTIVITTIDHNGKALEVWSVNNAWAKSVKFGDLSYDSDELREITLEIRYDWASCEFKHEASSKGTYFVAGEPGNNTPKP